MVSRGEREEGGGRMDGVGKKGVVGRGKYKHGRRRKEEG